MEQLILALCIGLAFAGLFVFEPWNYLVGKYLDFKPFNCALCMSLWGSILLMVIIGVPVHLAFISAFTTEFTLRKM